LKKTNPFQTCRCAWEEGEPTDVEKKFDLNFPDQEMVMEMAESWSINPSLPEERTDLQRGLGLLFLEKNL